MDKSVLIFFKNLRDLLKLRDQTPILPKKIGPLTPRWTVEQAALQVTLYYDTC